MKKIEEALNKILFSLLRSALTDSALSEEEKSLVKEDVLPYIFKLAKKHDLLHLLAHGLKKNGLISERLRPLENEIFKAVYRFQKIRHDYETLCSALEKASVPFLPLKGSVIRKYYPEPWMRTSCDIDILVHEKDSARAAAVLTDEYGYVFHEKGSHDISLYSPDNTHLELHYELVEDGLAREASSVLKQVWDTVCVKNGYSFFYEMPDEYFYFYHVAHMAKHFENGGCGIRPFIDLFILDNTVSGDKKKRDYLLSEGKLLKFADSVRVLSSIWLSGGKHDTVSRQLESYILRGGVYGSNENRITVQQQKKGGRLRYALSRIFLPYSELKFHYPVLQKHRWLTPIMEARRWFKLIFCGHLKRSASELKFSAALSAETSDNTKRFLESIGL